MGDLRTGRELLADASLSTDFLSVAVGSTNYLQLRRFLASCCAELQANITSITSTRIASAESVAAAEAPTDVIGASSSCSPASPLRESDGPAMDCTCILPGETASGGSVHRKGEWWEQGPLRTFWAFGQRTARLAALFDSLPQNLEDRFRLALRAADAAEASRAVVIASAKEGLEAPDNTFASVGMEAGPLLDPAELWEAEAEWGYATAAFDPATGRRRRGSVRVNRRQASRPRHRAAARQRRCRHLRLQSYIRVPPNIDSLSFTKVQH